MHLAVNSQRPPSIEHGEHKSRNDVRQKGPRLNIVPPISFGSLSAPMDLYLLSDTSDSRRVRLANLYQLGICVSLETQRTACFG